MRRRVVARNDCREDLPQRGRLLVQRVHDVLAIVDHVLVIGVSRRKQASGDGDNPQNAERSSH